MPSPLSSSAPTPPMDSAGDRRVLVTGGSRGLGLAICRRLLADHWDVEVASRTESVELTSLMREYPSRLTHHPVDFDNLEDVQRLSSAIALSERYSALVANAAVGTEGLLTLTSVEAIERCIRVNLLVPILLAREAIKGMLQRGGSLVFVSSVAAKSALSGLAAYSAAKGGLLSFSRSVAREYGRRQIRSNVVLPGFFDSDMNRSLDAEQRARVVRRTALRRLGQADEVAECVGFLLSTEARYVTGAELVVDGGMTC